MAPNDPDSSTPKRARKLTWSSEQLLLALVGLVAFGLGTSVHRDRSNLAVVLVALGMLLVLLAALLPRLQSFGGKFGGVDLSVSLLPPNAAVRDDVLVGADPAGTSGSGLDYRGTTVSSDGPKGFGDAVKGGRATFAVVNLENGHAWLSSRLYVFVQAITETREVKAVAFTSRNGTVDEFLGVVPACDVIARLSFAFPWLAVAFGKAWQDMRATNPERTRRLSIEETDDLYKKYEADLQQTEAPASTFGWALLDGPTWEHATWLDRALVKELFGAEMSTEFVVGDYETAQTIDEVLGISSARYVTIVSHQMEVNSVCDRWKLLDRATRGSRPRVGGS